MSHRPYVELGDALELEVKRLGDHPAANLLGSMAAIAMKMHGGDQYATHHLARIIRDLCKDRVALQQQASPTNIFDGNAAGSVVQAHTIRGQVNL